ncbi:MFS transporter [Terribacillus sp. 179-K 1B1 HS]|uniref:MFS transporter n=1 Tax=Terribacillus sp. 179-K 1B1 HS TaxID=3142388 RepID=UPI0039A0610F
MQRKIGLTHQVAYGSANLLGSGALAISGAWLMYFYTTFCGLSIVQAAAIFSIASVVDAVSNPIMGFVTDNFHKTRLGKRFGRRKFFILLGIPMMAVYPMLWVEGFGFWYYLLTFILFELIYTGVMVPYETLAAEMTNDFSLRSKLTGFKAIFGKVANFLAAFIPGRFIAEYGQDSPLPFFYTGLLYGGIMFIALISLYIFSWERPADQIKEEHTNSLWESMKKLFIDMLSTFRIRTFRHHLGMYLFGFGAEWLFASAFTYFIVFGLGQGSELVSNLLSFSSIMQLISTTFFIWLCVRMGFARPYRIALNIVILSVIAYTTLYFTGSQHMVILLFAITMFFGLGTGGVFYIPWNVYTFLADVDEAVTGRRREGLYAGVMTFAGKLTRAVIVYILGWVLGSFGFVSGETTQPQSAVYAVVGVFAVGVICLAIGGVISAYKMKLDRQSHSILIGEIERVNNGGSMKEVKEEVRDIMEALTGFPYDKCFGNNNVGYKSKLIDDKKQGKFTS